MELWYKQLLFTENPLDARPNATLIGMEGQEQQLKNFILKEELCFLHGLTGAGKTSLLKRVQETMTDHEFLYLDADALPQSFDLVSALKGKRSFFDKIRLKELPTKKPVLIVDEFQATDQRLILEARSRWENPNGRHIKSIVLAQISEQLKNVPGSFKDRLGNRVIHLKPQEDETMKKVLETRLMNASTGTHYYQKLSPQAIDFLVHIADGNVRRLLEFTDMIFDFHYQRFLDKNPLFCKDDYKVTFPAAKEILTVNNINVEGYIPEVLKKGKLTKENKNNEKKKVREEEITEKEVIPEQKEEESKIEPVQDTVEETQLVTQTFDKGFTLAEQNILRSLARHETMTLKQIATDIHLEINKCSGVVLNLKKKNALISGGEQNDEELWKLTESAKRTLVTR